MASIHGTVDHRVLYLEEIAFYVANGKLYTINHPVSDLSRHKFYRRVIEI